VLSNGGWIARWRGAEEVGTSSRSACVSSGAASLGLQGGGSGERPTRTLVPRGGIHGIEPLVPLTTNPPHAAPWYPPTGDVEA